MDVIPIVQSDASATNLRPKPAVPKKPLRLLSENDVNRTTHVREMIRKLQEKEQSNGNTKPTLTKMGGKTGKIPVVPEKDERNSQASNQTLEDLKAIDEDIEKLRKQIEERDKIISALREAAEAKDKKLDNLLVEYSKLQSSGKLELDTSPEPNRANSSSPSSPPLCNGELCWTDSFVNKNYHEPVYAQLLNDHTALQKVYNELRAKLDSKGEDYGLLKEGEAMPKTDSGGNKLEGGENAINLIMAEQIRVLKEREAQLIWEAEELREQNDLMEFRILELEESRKEFLDKEVLNENKHRTEKIVWRERDLEEVSDSGVMSLPTSEDLTSDSELGEAIRNYSPLGAVTNLGLSTCEISHLDPVGINDLKLKKSLKSSECLQESGIFVDAEPSSECAIPSGTLSKACQTESFLDKTLLDIIDSSCDLFLSKNPGYLEEAKLDDLSTEISKLSVIQKRIQQKTSPPASRSPHAVESCPHLNSVSFYEERLGQLEDKLKIYESSGDTKDVLLAKRLQKEVDLAHRVKELTDKVVSLEATNKKLEEEKCEFEEAENDTRFQCQRLEVRLQELIEKNTELEVELERQKVIMNEEKRRGKKKGSLEDLLSKYEQRNFELEEKEVEARQRLSMLEAAMPAIVAYNVFKIVQNPEFATMLPVNSATIETPVAETKLKASNSIAHEKLEEVFSDHKKVENEMKKLEDAETEKEKALRIKIKELEEKAAKDREVLEEMTNALKAYKMVEKSERDVENLRSDDVDLFEELKQMVTNEIELRAQIERLEKKEQAYMQSLENADEIWAGIEADYKRRLAEAEDANKDLQKRISQLEETQTELARALADQPLDSDSTKERGVFQLKIQELILQNKKLKAEINRSLDEKFEEHRKFLELENAALKEEIKKMESDSAKEEVKNELLAKKLDLARQELENEREIREKLRRDLEEKSQSVTSMETNLQSQISELTQELNQKSKELSSLEVTVAELREEVETLENKVSELMQTIQTTIKNQEEASAAAKAPKGVPQSSLPANDSLPEPEETLGELVETPSELPAINEILVKTEVKLPSLEVLVPSRFIQRFLVFAALFYPRQEVNFLFPCSETAGRVLLKSAQHWIDVNIVEVPRVEEPNEVDVREEEIFQLSIKNTELQQTLERMEEESKLKDKEFEELQRIALEIRQEQKNLESLYGVVGKQEEAKDRSAAVEETVLRVHEREESSSQQSVPEDPRRVPSIEILQVINPIVVKTPDQVSATLSSLQIALDNLRNKYRSSNFMFKPVLDELKQKGDNRDIEEFVKQLSLEFSSVEDKEKHFEGHPKELALLQSVNESHSEPTKVRESQKTRSTTPKPLGKCSSATYPFVVSPPVKHFAHRPLEPDPEFSFAAPITTVRKVGDDGIFLEWDVSQQPLNVTGFEIKVNGLLSHRVRSSTRNKALLRPLNLKDEISIHLFAISGNGRSTRSSHVTYPNEVFFH